jgi:hypothetical protein
MSEIGEVVSELILKEDAEEREPGFVLLDALSSKLSA